MHHAVVEAGEDIAGAGNGARLPFNLQLIAACGNIHAQRIFDGDQILIIMTKDSSQQLRPVKNNLYAGTITGFSGLGFARHSRPYR